MGDEVNVVTVGSAGGRAPGEVQRLGRRTRAEQQAGTRAALVAAAAEVLAERGFHGTSVEEVTARAGFTRGAFYSNFATKEALVGAVLDDRLARDVAAVGPIVTAAESTDDLVTRLRAMGPDGDGPQVVRLLAELRLHALRSPEARARQAVWEQRQRDDLRTAIAHVLDAGGITPPADLDLLALLLQVLGDGIALHREVEGDAIAPQAFLDLVELLLRAAVALDR